MPPANSTTAAANATPTNDASEQDKKETTTTAAASATNDAPSVEQTIDERIAQAQADERKRCSSIRALCDQAKRPSLAGKFIESGTAVAEVQATLFKAMCEDNTPVGDTGSGDQHVEKKDPDAQFKKEFADNRKLYQQMGFDEAGYIQSRRIDEGLDDIAVLTIKKDD